jgi:hypothetical protein
MRSGEATNTRALPRAVLAIALLLGTVAATQPQAPSDDCEYFAETGHYVCGEFLSFFHTRGGIEIFGYPITEAFDDPALSLHVQYFQRARMEYHPGNQEPYKVLLGLLIDDLGYSFPPPTSDQIPAYNSSLHHHFSETGHIVSYAFLDFYREKGGLDIFGYPRSEFLYEDGYIVQYFQRARVEWHPEAAEGSQMRLTDIGSEYVRRFGLPGDYDKSLVGPRMVDPGADPSVTRLDASASVRYVTMGREGTQTVFVYVNDQRHEPVQDAAVSIVIRYQTGGQSQACDPTNESGFTKCSFGVDSLPPGEKVIIDVSAGYGSLTASTQTFFIPWW